MDERFQLEHLKLIVVSVFVLCWPVEAEVFVALLFIPVFIRMNTISQESGPVWLTSRNHERI